VGWSGCDTRRESRVPGVQGLLQNGIRHLHRKGKKLLNGEPVPAHRLLLDYQVSDRMISYIECLISRVSKSNPHPSDEDLSLETPRPGAPGVHIPGPQVRGTWGTHNWYKIKRSMTKSLTA
jgi:hypothetical protein